MCDDTIIITDVQPADETTTAVAEEPKKRSRVRKNGTAAAANGNGHTNGEDVMTTTIEEAAAPTAVAEKKPKRSRRQPVISHAELAEAEAEAEAEAKTAEMAAIEIDPETTAALEALDAETIDERHSAAEIIESIRADDGYSKEDYPLPRSRPETVVDAMTCLEAFGHVEIDGLGTIDPTFFLTLHGQKNRVGYKAGEFIALAQAVYDKHAAESPPTSDDEPPLPFDGDDAAREAAADELAAMARDRISAAIKELGKYGAVVVHDGSITFTDKDGDSVDVLNAGVFDFLLTQQAAAEGVEPPSEPTGVPLTTGQGQLPLMGDQQIALNAEPVAFRVLRESFHERLKLVGNGLPGGKVTLPILGNVLIEARGGRVALVTTNLALSVRTDMSAKVEVEGAFTMPAKTLTEIVGLAKGEQFEVVLDPRTLTMTWTCGKQTGRLKGIEADEFPIIPTIDESKGVWEVPSKAFTALIDHVVGAAAADDTRPVLAGVLLKLSEDTIEASAADGFRLHTTSVSLPRPSAAAAYDAIIPATAMERLARIVDGNEHITIQIARNGGQVVFAQGRSQLTTRIIDGKYPDVARIIPTRCNVRVIFKRADLEDAIKMGKLFAVQGVIKIQVPQVGPIRITASNVEIGDQQTDVTAVTHFIDEDAWRTSNKEPRPDEAFTALNAKFLAEIVASSSSKEIAMEIINSTTPVKFTEVGGDNNFIGIVMPMTVR